MSDKGGAEKSREMLGLDTRQAAAALGIHESTVRLRIRKGMLRANKLGARWQVYLDGRGCCLCEAAGVQTILDRCAICSIFHCAFCTVSICREGQHALSRGVADA